MCIIAEQSSVKAPVAHLVTLQLLLLDKDRQNWYVISSKVCCIPPAVTVVCVDHPWKHAGRARTSS